MFSLLVEVDGAIRRYDTTALAAGDLTPPLRKLGAHLKAKARARYMAQSFAPLAESTVEKRAQKGLRGLSKTLRKEADRAIKKAAGGDTDALALMLATLGKAPQRRIGVLIEFQQRHRMKGRDLQSLAGGTPLTLKQQQGLSKRTVRAVQKAVDRPILGGLPQTLEIDVESGAVTLASRTGKHWTDVHNKGGAAGHGAQIPQRETIKVEEEDLEFLEAALKEHHLLAFVSAE